MLPDSKIILIYKTIVAIGVREEQLEGYKDDIKEIIGKEVLFRRWGNWICYS